MNRVKISILSCILISIAVLWAVPEIYAEQPVVVQAIGDKSGNEGAEFSLDVAIYFSDPTPTDQLAFTADGLPTGLGITSTGAISGTLPKVVQNEPFTVTVTATDGGLSVKQSFQLTVINSINELPILARNSGLTINQNASAATIGNTQLQLTDENNPGPGSLTYTLTAVPTKGTLMQGTTDLAIGVTFSQADIDAGSISFAPSGSTNGGDSFSFNYADEKSGALGPATFTVNIMDNVPPTMYGTAAYVDSTHVEVTFSEDVKGADNPANYRADGLTIGQVARVSGNIYRLTTSVHKIGTVYTITGNGITDLAGNSLAAGGNTVTFTRPDSANSAPGVPVLKSPESGGANTPGEVSILTPSLSVNAVTDPDGDPVTYTFQVSTTSDFATLVAKAEGIPAKNGVASFDVSSSLADHTLYHWRVQAYDGNLNSGFMPTAVFFVNTANDKPAGLAVSAPTDATQTDTVTPVLAVTNATDADLDPLTYEFTVARDPGFTDKAADSPPVAQGSGGTSWTVPAGILKDNAWYYWRCRAKDLHGAYSETVTAYFFVNTANDAPGAPKLNAPQNGTYNNNESTTLTPILVVDNAVDPDGYNQPRLYTFEIDTSPDFNSTDKQRVTNVAEGNGTTGWTPQPLKDNTLWYWRSMANDGAADGPWMEKGSFFVNTRNDAPNMPSVVTPVNNGEVDSLFPTLTVDAVDNDHDPLTYEFAVYSDSTPSPTTQVAGGVSTNMSWAVSTPLVDNTRYYWIARAKDSHGDYSRWSAVSSFTVKNKASDNVPPSMTITAPGAGLPVTNAIYHTITWTAADPDSPPIITLYHAPDASGTGGTQIATGIAKDVTSYTWDTSGLADGVYYVYGVIADGRSQVTAVSPGPITIDRTPPAVPQVAGAALTNNPTPTWSWAGGGGGSGNYRYNLDRDDFSAGGSLTSAAAFTPASQLAGGMHTLYVQERDEAGNWSPSGSFKTAIDLDLPTAVISGAPTQATRDTGITLTVGGDDVVVYRYSLDSGAPSGETPVGTPIQLAGLGDGIHTIAVFGRDSAGNWQTTGTSVQWEVDTIPPSAVINGVPSNPANTGTATLTVGGGGVTAYRYLIDGGAYSGETGISTPITITALAEGMHTVSVIGRDLAGNWQAGESAATVSWMVDLSAPVLEVSTLPDGAFTNMAELNVAGLVTDANGVANVIGSYVGGGTSTTGEILLDQKGAFSQIVTLNIGANSLTITAVDRAGNRTSNTRTINFDPIGPKLAIQTPADNLKTNNPIVEIRGATDKTAAIDVTVYDRSQTPVSSQAATIAGAEFSATANLSEGINTVVISAQDLTGNKSSYKRTVTLDNQKPTLAVTEPAQDLRTNLNIMVVKGTVADALSEVAVTVKQDDRDAESVTLATSESGQTFEKTVTFTESRVYHLLVTATDAAGNEASVQRNIIYAPPAKGDINDDQRVDVLDALIALQISNGMLAQTDHDLIHGDVAPLIEGKPVSDGKIDVGDAVVILEAAVGLINLAQ